jgi:hypothetical protein
MGKYFRPKSGQRQKGRGDCYGEFGSAFSARVQNQNPFPSRGKNPQKWFSGSIGLPMSCFEKSGFAGMVGLEWQISLLQVCRAPNFDARPQTKTELMFPCCSIPDFLQKVVGNFKTAVEFGHAFRSLSHLDHGLLTQEISFSQIVEESIIEHERAHLVD